MDHAVDDASGSSERIELSKKWLRFSDVACVERRPASGSRQTFLSYF
jgi:hypothetical protein